MATLMLATPAASGRGGLVLTALGFGAIVCMIEKDNARRGPMIQAAFRGNYVLMGIPLVSNIFGDEAIAIPTMMIAVIVPLYNILGVFVLETFRGGHFDLLHILRGVNLDVEVDQLRSIFDEVGIAFLFANKMHPSMRFAAPVRRALGFPTAFNVLGPLTNPAKVQACAIGAAKEENARLMAGVYASRGLSALVLRGATTGLDELTTADSNQIWIVSGGQVSEVAFDARESLGMASSLIEDLAGGEAAANAPVARRGPARPRPGWGRAPGPAGRRGPRHAGRRSLRGSERSCPGPCRRPGPHPVRRIDARSARRARAADASLCALP